MKIIKQKTYSLRDIVKLKSSWYGDNALRKVALVEDYYDYDGLITDQRVEFTNGLWALASNIEGVVKE